MTHVVGRRSYTYLVFNIRSYKARLPSPRLVSMWSAYVCVTPLVVPTWIAHMVRITTTHARGLPGLRGPVLMLRLLQLLVCRLFQCLFLSPYCSEPRHHFLIVIISGVLGNTKILSVGCGPYIELLLLLLVSRYTLSWPIYIARRL